VQINKFGAHQANEASANLYDNASKFLAASGAVMMAVCCFLAWRFARNLAVRVRGASVALQAMSNGALNQSVQVTGHDEVDQLLGALQRLNSTLREVVSGVRSNAQGVAAASTRMLADSNDLARRSDARAEAITQTAATMAQLGTTVSHNAESAKRANVLALSSSKLATEGGEVVSEVVTTMKGIDDSSKRIAAIIGVIDSIAFQTNILALNAAVEAARAGEQGRGFAVVASEVRALAQRSAAAAKEVKTLIAGSLKQVEAGVSVVRNAGQAMNEIVTNAGQLDGLIEGIAQASVQQSRGVAQVGQSVQALDRMTQQNAALVEQSAAAAEGLRQQAVDLATRVARFRLPVAA
jgi:methyl-accepting chemotaxis protein